MDLATLLTPGKSDLGAPLAPADRTYRIGRQGRRQCDRSARRYQRPCFGGPYGSLWPASDGEVFSATIFGEQFRPDDSGSACPRLSGRTCTLPDGGPVDLVTGGHQNCRYSRCLSMPTPIWHTLSFFVVDISSEKTEKGYVAEVR